MQHPTSLTTQTTSTFQLQKKISDRRKEQRPMSRRQQRLAGLDPDRHKKKRQPWQRRLHKTRKRKRYIWTYGRLRRPKLPSSFIENLTPFSTAFLPFFLGMGGKIRRRKYGRMGGRRKRWKYKGQVKTHLCSKHHRRVTKLIHTARQMAVIGYRYRGLRTSDPWYLRNGRYIFGDEYRKKETQRKMRTSVQRRTRPVAPRRS